MPAPRLTPVLLAACLGACEAAEGGRYPAETLDGRLIAMGGAADAPGQACFSCHGLAGEGDGGASPRLAGLDAGYLQKQLHDYADGRRPDPVMSPIARALSDRERYSVAHYYAALAPVSPAAASPPERVLGERLHLAGAPDRGLLPCAACHGPGARGAGFPAIAAQPAAYTVEQLRRWKRGERRNDPRGVMADQAGRLTEAEIAALAAYLAGLDPGGGRPAEAAS